MRLNISKSKNSISYYAQKTVYVDGKQKSIIVEKLGTHAELLEKLNGEDPLEWAKKRVKELTKLEEEELKINITLSSNKTIESEQQRLFNGGYLFLSKIYKDLGLPTLTKEIRKKYKFKFDLDSILSRLVYGRILFPKSKLTTFELAHKLIEKPNFELQHVYRALDILEKESENIQAAAFKQSLTFTQRNTDVLYYDCTNYFFEIERESGIRQYGYSKEHRPNPIVQMGLFIDKDGIPLAFSINPGNINEQVTLTPLETKIINNFGLSKFIVCTDAGLASETNRKFNDVGDKAFITTQSIKKLKKHLKEWSLEPNKWRLSGSDKEYNINNIDEDEFKDAIFYKERWINENNFEQKLIVSFSLKYRNYTRSLREQQIIRAEKLIRSGASKLKKANANDCKRFIKRISSTKSGEVAEKTAYSIDQDIVAREAVYDGFYAVCTNITDETEKVIRINKNRWEIEQCFRIMKSDFKARPVYLSNDQRIKAHFLTCFIALLIFKLLEKKLDYKFTCTEIIDTLKTYNFLKLGNKGYIPAYTKNNITDFLHEKFGFKTDYEIVTHDQIKKILKK